MAVKDSVESTILGNKIVIYSKTFCPFCRRAKQLFAERFPDTPATVIELDESQEGPDIQSYLLSKTGQRTVPNIFINQRHIGGCDDVTKLYSEGKLEELVNA